MSKEIERSETLALERGVLPKEAQTGCCGGAAPTGVDACCALDAEIKSEGGSGCGCAPKAASGKPRRGGCC